VCDSREAACLQQPARCYIHVLNLFTVNLVGIKEVTEFSLNKFSDVRYLRSTDQYEEQFQFIPDLINSDLP
jgi:hypothetical protein